MKKIIITLLFAGSALLSYSQTEFAAGIKAGPNFATLDTDASAGEIYENRTGWHVGAFMLIKGEKFGFQPEVIFSQQGSKFKYNTNSPSLNQNFSYVNIPLIFKLYTIAGINLQLGPQIGLLTSAEREDFVTGTSGPISKEDIKSDLKKTDISLALGVGWDFPFGLSADVRYNVGVQDINEATDGEEAKSRVFQISLGWNFLK